MADITKFPTLHDVLVEETGGTKLTMTATTAVKAGMLVAINATGVSMAVDPCKAVSGSQPIGVAVYDIAAGKKGLIASDGCVVIMVNADDTTTIDAGETVEFNDNDVGGTISGVATNAISGAVGTNHPGVCGIALEDIAGGGTGKVLIKIIPQNVQLNNA